MQKFLILLLAAALPSVAETNAEEEVPDDEKAPVINVHLISSIEVAMIKNNNQLKNGDKSLQKGVEFFDKLAMKHAAYNTSDSKLLSKETLTLLSSSCEKNFWENCKGK